MLIRSSTSFILASFNLDFPCILVKAIFFSTENTSAEKKHELEGDYPLCRTIFFSTDLIYVKKQWNLDCDYPLCRTIFFSTKKKLKQYEEQFCDYPLCRTIFFSTVTSEDPHKQGLPEAVFAHYSQNILKTLLFKSKTVPYPFFK